MNCIEIFTQNVRNNPEALALWIPGQPKQKETSFAELLDLSTRAQSLFHTHGLKPGDSVLLMAPLSPHLYASITALLSVGAIIILVEPWMSVAEIQKVIANARPKLFISSVLGFLWGAKVKAIRQIPHWIQVTSIYRSPPQGKLHLESLDASTTGILTFTSGTTGKPKGVVRNQGYMIQQHEILTKSFENAHLKGPDLCIFANFAISNLAAGRGSIIIPPSWSKKAIQAVDALPAEKQPESLATGPAFLIELMKHAQLPQLKSIHVGGALTDCWIFEKGMEKWPEAHWAHVYGGSEVEPVALADARQAVHESRKRNYFQTLYLGKEVPEIQAQPQTDGLWVAGPHVCPEYFGNAEENRLFKKKDDHGTLWHFMGDRVGIDPSGWWFQGRAGQAVENFDLEQKIYFELQSSKSFIRAQGTDLYLIGEGLSARRRELLLNFPELKDVVETKIYRDRRHRARIDRHRTISKGPRWLARKLAP
jgi:acyl-coenzyme A synthetase/AMP-(fatty) acid ligase